MTRGSARGGEETKWLGRKGSASYSALVSVFRFQHHGALLPSTVWRVTVYTNHCSCGKLQTSRALSNAMPLVSSSRRSCLEVGRRVAAPSASWKHVRGHHRWQCRLHVPSRRAAVQLQLHQSTAIPGFTRSLAPCMHLQPRSLMPAQHRLYSVSPSPEHESDNM